MLGRHYGRFVDYGDPMSKHTVGYAVLVVTEKKRKPAPDGPLKRHQASVVTTGKRIK